MSKSKTKIAKKTLRANITSILIDTLIDPSKGIIKSSKKGNRIIRKGSDKLARKLVNKLSPDDMIVKGALDKADESKVPGGPPSLPGMPDELKPSVAANAVKTAPLKRGPKTRKQSGEN